MKNQDINGQIKLDFFLGDAVDFIFAKFCCFISILKNSYAIKKIFFNNIGKIVIKLKNNVLFFNQNTLT